MDPERTDRIRRRLQARREELLAQIRDQNARAAQLMDEGVPDYGDLALADGLKEFLHLLGDSKRELLLNIDEALDRMQRGAYGDCADCGRQIPEERLEILPQARYCTACQQQREAAAETQAGPGRGKL